VPQEQTNKQRESEKTMILLAILLPPLYFLTQKKFGMFILTSVMFFLAVIFMLMVVLIPGSFILWALAAIPAIRHNRRQAINEMMEPHLRQLCGSLFGRVAWSGIFCLLVTFACFQTEAQTMTLNSPNAGATWQVGTSQTVSWSVSGDTSQISYFVVRLSINNGSSYTDISAHLSTSTRSFNYTPTSGQATSTAVCWVRAFNSSGSVLAGAISSGAFAIANPPPTMTLNSPNVGATWQVGTSQTVGWSVSGDTTQISYFVVRLSINNGSSYTDISSHLSASTRSFNYTPTSGQATSTAVCWVRAFNSGGTVLAGAISSGAFTITTPALSITTTAFNPATATVGTGYSAQQAVTATGGTTPYSWSASGLPSGMAINSSSGAPYGTPTVSGTFNVTVTVTDSSSPQKTASKVLSLTVNTPTLSITTTAFNPATATVGTGYSAQQAVAATGGQTPYSWSASGLPSGMSINSSSGAPFGTPTVSGTFNVTVTVTDSSSPQKTASKVLTLTVLSALSITTTAFDPPTATVGVGYAAQQAVAATGGTTPYSWSASGLPGGMSINSSSGAPYGTPTVSGTFNVTVTVTDSSSPQKTASKVLSLSVLSGFSISNTAFNPATATIGTGYAAQQAVTATGGQTPYIWSASGLPIGMAINSSSGAPYGTPTVSGTFNVTVTAKDSGSPQKTASKVLSLIVTPTVQPDLIIQNVTFSPSSVAAGNSFTVNFRVRNNGPASCVATLARLRITADTTPTSADPPLSPLDVSIPAISAGNYHDFSATITIPVTTPQGLYYVGVFADADNRAGQSDITNDRGLSASRMTVTGNGATLPVISAHPQNRNVTQGDTVSFSVTVGGTGPFSYQWKREGRPIYGETSSQLVLRNVSTLQAGNYAVDVANAAGTVSSFSALLTVSPLTPTTSQPIPGQCTIYQTIDTNLPTVVITHGWQPADWQNPALPDWVIDMGHEINDRCALAGLPANASGQRVNIIRYYWREAFTLNPFSATSYTRGHGSALAKQLKSESFLGESYDKKIHFIGHSFGSLVNAYAVHDLRTWNVEQFTILDAPFLMPSVDPWLFHRYLPPARVKWVDNYYGTPGSGGVGGPITGAAPSGGLSLNANHSGVHDFYHTTIANAASSQGFYFSCLLPNFDSRPQPQYWSPPAAPLYTGLLGVLNDGIELPWYLLEHVGDGLMQIINYQMENQLRGVIILSKPSTAIASISKPGGPSPAGAGGPQPSGGGGIAEVSAAIDLVIPSDAQYLTFKFLCTNAGPGDWLTAKFNDNLLMSFRADSFTGTNFQTATMSVSNYAGQAGQLVVKLNSGGTDASEFVIGDFSFLTTSAPVFSNLRVLNGAFQFDLRGLVGSNYVVQVSANLINWSSMNTSTIPTEGSITITNPISGQPKQFFRAVMP